MEFRFPPDLFGLLTRSFPSILPTTTRSKPAREPAAASTVVADPLPARIRTDSAGAGGCSVPLFRFRPYVAKVPWHGGARGFLSQLFPRYGHYCGPNWSSGKDAGSMLWDRRPIDWLDFCCYCHDIGYDTHHQSALLRADLAFLDCLERPRGAHAPTRGDTRAALLYRSMCIAGLRNVLIPYRMQLVRLQSGRMPFQEVVENLIAGRLPLSEAIRNLIARRLGSLMRGRGNNNAFRQKNSE